MKATVIYSIAVKVVYRSNYKNNIFLGFTEAISLFQKVNVSYILLSLYLHKENKILWKNNSFW